ncbi:MAG TPA: nitroreductase family protein [bacterium]|nr:nitroreductase family protein [bacterium]
MITLPDCLECIKTRRVTRYFSDAAVPQEVFVKILEAGRWAPIAGNRRIQHFLAVQNRETITLIRAVSPGMFGHPAALAIICIDWAKLESLGCKRHNHGVYIDVGTAAENMMLAGHALGLGTGPVTSFSTAAVSTILGLPEWLTPAMIVCIGYPAKAQPMGRNVPAKPTLLKDLVSWEQFVGTVSKETA